MLSLSHTCTCSYCQKQANRVDLVKQLHIVPAKDSLAQLTHGQLRENTGFQWSAYNICEAWAEKRRYFTAKSGRLDVYVNNHILYRLLDINILSRSLPSL